MNEIVPLAGQVEVASKVLGAGLMAFGVMMIVLLLREAVLSHLREREEVRAFHRRMLERWRRDHPDIVEAYREMPRRAGALVRRSAVADADRHAARGLRHIEGDRDD